MWTRRWNLFDTHINSEKIQPDKGHPLDSTEVTYRRLIAPSNCQGRFVAPRTRTPLVSFPTPSICTNISVLILLLASDSPSPLGPHNASSSSMKMIDGLLSRAIVKSCFTNLRFAVSCFYILSSSIVRTITNLSLSPIHLLTKSLLLTEKKVLFASVATALARYDLPVPGGP